MLKPHRDIINKVPKVLIIGYGWVGQFIGEYFKKAHYVNEDGVVRRVEDNSVVNGYHNYDFGFVCVPTPMLKNGRCDISIVRGAVKNWIDWVGQFCLKSTVEIGTTNYLNKKYGNRFCFSPEYLGETVGHPLTDARKETFIILGGDKSVTGDFAELWTLVTNSYTKIYQVPAETAELCKLMENSWIATKVMFCNEFFSLAESIGVDWNELRQVWLADPRVSPSHTWVFRNNRGFSGKCLPKDINNLVYYFGGLKNGKAKLMSFLLRRNAELRKQYNDEVMLLPNVDKKFTKKTD